MKVVIAAVVVSVVILAECVLAFLLIPSTAAVEASLHGDHEAPAAETKEKPDAHGGHGGHGGGHEKKPAKADAHGGHGSHDKPKADKHGGGHGGHGSHGKSEKKSSHSADPHGNAEVETDLGRYNVVVHQPATGVTIRVNFHLYGTVAEASHEEADELAKKNQHRLRDSVIVEIRNSDIADLTDPGLALIKRKILAKSNELLGQPLLKGIVFSDFSFVEQ